MKIILSVFITIMIIFIYACKKENTGDVLTGKWNLFETYADAGNGIIKWDKVAPGTYDYIKFYGKGKLSGTSYSEYEEYKIKDSVTLVFIRKDKTEQNFRYSIKDGLLSMRPDGPLYCFEGCGYRYKKLP